MTSPQGPVESPSGDDRSLGELISSTTEDLSTLLKAELELAKLELRQEAGDAARAGGMLGAGAVLAHAALLLLLFAAAWGLAAVVPDGVAFLIVGAVVALVAAAVLSLGRTRMKKLTPVVPQTTRTIEEDVQWARQLRN